jgi:hypothetical protein
VFGEQPVEDRLLRPIACAPAPATHAYRRAAAIVSPLRRPRRLRPGYARRAQRARGLPIMPLSPGTSETDDGAGLRTTADTLDSKLTIRSR